MKTVKFNFCITFNDYETRSYTTFSDVEASSSTSKTSTSIVLSLVKMQNFEKLSFCIKMKKPKIEINFTDDTA